MIDSLDTYTINFEKLMDAYKQQRLDKMEELLNDPESGIAENQDAFLDKRNKNWVAQLKDIMLEKPVFVAVGAGHLVGKQGLISLLRAAGYTVNPIVNK